MVTSIIVCKHGKLGFSASLRFTDESHNTDISANNKYSLYKTIDYMVYRDMEIDKALENS